MENFWKKFGKVLLWILLAALFGFLAYMIFAHRKVIMAAVKGEPLPEPKEGKCCPCFCKKTK